MYRKRINQKLNASASSSLVIALADMITGSNFQGNVNNSKCTYLWLGFSWKCDFWIDLWIKIPKIVHYGNTSIDPRMKTPSKKLGELVTVEKRTRQ